MDSFFKIKIPLNPCPFPTRPPPPPSAFPPISMLNLAKFSCHQPKTSQTTLNRGKGGFSRKTFFQVCLKCFVQNCRFWSFSFLCKGPENCEQNNKRLTTFLANKEEKNCHSGILFTLFTCFVSSLFTKKSLVVHWITKLYVWNDNFKYIPDFFFFFLLL